MSAPLLRAMPVVFCLVVALAANAEDSVRTLVDGGRLSELRWPNVSDYRPHLDAFYRSRNDALAWTRDGQATPQAVAVTELFAKADARGLNATDYDGDRWSARIAALSNASPEALARFDVMLTATLMRYVSDLHIGRVNPSKVQFYLDVSQKKYDLPQLVTSVIDNTDAPAFLEAVEPQLDGYRRLRSALATYTALAAAGEIPALPDVKIVEPGDAWPGVPALAELLRRVGDLDAPVEGDRYDGAIVDAVKRFQRRHGLSDDGRIGAGTLAALRVPLSRRVQQIRLAMDRFRWIPNRFSAPPLVVNIPEFRLRAYSPRQEVELEMNVVVGKAYRHETPVFADTMEYVVFRPYWNVPSSIQRNELMPKIRADRSYAARNNYQVIDGRIRQKPGPKNALGLVKFIFPNSMNIYLHDTPSQAAFAEARRDFSHGCIRLSKPAELAAWVLRGDPKWTPEAIEEAMQRGKNDVRVNLPTPTPVLILYATAVAPADGKVYFFDDIYGHDATLEKALAGGYPYPW